MPQNPLAPVILPTVITIAGLQPQSPVIIWQELLANVAAVNPGYTANLPGGLIEDISSTDVAAIVLCDNARVETVNSLTPYGANAWLLNLLGVQMGVPLGLATFTSVSVTFTGTPGFIVPIGFLVGDGTYQYAVQDGGIIGSNGQSAPLYCLATQSGSWAVAPGTVTLTINSTPSVYNLQCSNPLAGTPGIGPVTESAYRAQCLQAQLAASMGMPRYMSTLLQNVPGVQARLVSVNQQVGGGWEVICGGGDPYAMAYAIFSSILDISTLVGSTMQITQITNAANAQITTDLNHGYAIGQACLAEGVEGMVQINGVSMTVASIVDEKNFTTNVNSSGFSAYTLGGVLTPNLRNSYVPIINFPNVYQVVSVNPPEQAVTIGVTWNTSATNFLNGPSLATLGAPAIAAYVNNITVGQPMNLFNLQQVFVNAVADILAPALLTRMIFEVQINNVTVSAEIGTGIIAGDPESYFFTDATGLGITITQG